MQVIETKVYTFDELSDDAKEKARDWWREGNDYPFLSADMRERAGELLKGAGIEATTYRVYYSLGYCQGDGAMIELDGIWNGYGVSVRQSGHYCHEYSTSIEVSDRETGEEVDKKDFQEVYVPLCIELEKYGYRIIEDANSDATVDEDIRANEYTFTEDGKRFG